MGSDHAIVVLGLLIIAGLIIGGAVQVLIIRIAVRDMAWDLQRLADRIAPEDDV